MGYNCYWSCLRMNWRMKNYGRMKSWTRNWTKSLTSLKNYWMSCWNYWRTSYLMSCSKNCWTKKNYSTMS